MGIIKLTDENISGLERDDYAYDMAKFEIEKPYRFDAFALIQNGDILRNKNFLKRGFLDNEENGFEI